MARVRLRLRLRRLGPRQGLGLAAGIEVGPERLFETKTL
jgi:hypothetical protein